jgi:hypothetical protein
VRPRPLTTSAQEARSALDEEELKLRRSFCNNHCIGPGVNYFKNLSVISESCYVQIHNVRG